MPEPEDKNPADELLKIPFSEISKSVLVNQAITTTIFKLQIRIIAQLEGKEIEEVQKEVNDIFDEVAKKTMDSFNKTI